MIQSHIENGVTIDIPEAVIQRKHISAKITRSQKIVFLAKLITQFSIEIVEVSDVFIVNER